MKSVTEWVSSSFDKDGGKQTKAQHTKPAASGDKPAQQSKPAAKHPAATHRKQGNAPKQHAKPHAKPQHPAPAGGGKGKVRVFPLGGFEQIGRNCMVIEVNENYYIVDLGLQFPDEDMLGIDYLIPDISFFKGKEDRIKGVFFTHGHLDHIGGVQHLLDKLKFPPLLWYQAYHRDD